MLHQGWHILNLPADYAGTHFPCGVCGGHEHQQYTHGGSSDGSSGCAGWHETTVKSGGKLVTAAKKKKAPKTLKAQIGVVLCKTAGDNYKYKVTLAKKFSVAQPCTNTLVLCPSCPPVHGHGSFFWKYSPPQATGTDMMGMRRHWHDQHSGEEMPNELTQELVITEQESVAVNQKGSQPPKKRSRSKKK
jgi:hypothetical protein